MHAFVLLTGSWGLQRAIKGRPFGAESLSVRGRSESGQQQAGKQAGAQAGRQAGK